MIVISGLKPVRESVRRVIVTKLMLDSDGFDRSGSLLAGTAAKWSDTNRLYPRLVSQLNTQIKQKISPLGYTRLGRSGFVYQDQQDGIYAARDK